jgi:hypothetical protein
VNRLVNMVAAGALLVFGAAAQDPEALAKMKAELDATHAGMVQMKTIGAVKGMTVKGAPYSGEEVTENNQMLADGTRIHRENKTSVYRDSEGRTRRESPDNITITDPVANVTYLLDPKSMTGQKLSMAGGNFLFYRTESSSSTGPGPATATFSMTSSAEGPARIVVNGTPLDDKLVAEAMAKAKASGGTQTLTYERHEVTTAVSGGSGTGIGMGTATGNMAGAPSRVTMKKSAGEPLGKQMMEGVNAEGVREVSTIAAGAIGNDRPIQLSSESWYSADLQMNVMTRRSDPRTGDEIFRLTNISRSEPAAYLFQPPTGYQITERK